MSKPKEEIDELWHLACHAGEIQIDGELEIAFLNELKRDTVELKEFYLLTLRMEFLEVLLHLKVMYSRGLFYLLPHCQVLDQVLRWCEFSERLWIPETHLFCQDMLNADIARDLKDLALCWILCDGYHYWWCDSFKFSSMDSCHAIQ